jgi:hypothetical protein
VILVTATDKKRMAALLRCDEPACRSLGPTAKATAASTRKDAASHGWTTRIAGNDMLDYCPAHAPAAPAAPGKHCATCTCAEHTRAVDRFLESAQKAKPKKRRAAAKGGAR